MSKIKSMFITYPRFANLILVIALACAVLFITGWFNRGLLKHFTFFEMSDQINYLTTARNFLEHGRLDSSLIYIGALNQPYTKNTLYMPGYPLILALIFRLFGYGVIQALLPSLLGYVAGAGLTFLIAWEIIGRKTAWLSAIFFLFFPLNLLFAFTAMTEIPFLATGLAAFYIFIHLKPGWRWSVGPFLLAVVFLIRETGALLVILMAGYMLLADWKKYWKETLVFGLMTFFLLVVIYVSPLSSGRISMLSNMTGSSLYFDAEIAPIEPGISGIINFLIKRAWINWQFNTLRPLEIFSFGILFNSIQLGILYTLLKNKSSQYIFSVTLFFVSVFLLIFLVYEIGSFRGIRALLFTGPFLLIFQSAVIGELIDSTQSKYRWASWVSLALFVTLWLVLSSQTISNFNDKTVARTETKTIEFIESLQHDNRKVLVSDYTLAIPYVEKYYPVQFAFMPSNRAAMELLLKKADVGTVIVDSSLPINSPLSRRDLLDLGFKLVHTTEFRDIKYLVFQMPDKK